MTLTNTTISSYSWGVSNAGTLAVKSPRDAASGQATGIASPRDLATGQIIAVLIGL